MISRADSSQPPSLDSSLFSHFVIMVMVRVIREIRVVRVVRLVRFLVIDGKDLVLFNKVDQLVTFQDLYR